MGKKILKALGILLAIVVVGIVCWGLTLWFQWDAWVGIALFIAILALFFGFGFLKRMVYRSRQRLNDALERRRSGAGAAKKIAVDIRGQWKAAIETLKRSSLKKQGDPVYVLPWYMVIGRQASGKTTALTRARLTSPIKEVNQSVLVTETQGIDWWYFDHSVMIDTSGRYVAAENPGDARDEWKRLLGLLAKTRRKEPLNGLVVTVAADMLLFAAPDALAEEGRLVRNRIDELMRVMDTKFPVYLVVTKCDSLYGLDEWANRLPPKTLEQALGYCGGAEGMSTADFLDRAFNSVLERLRDLRLVLSERISTIAAGLLLLPNEFERLRPGLEKFFAGAFGENPYLETPLLRGMFFCSGMQRGGASSYVLKDSGLPEQTVLLSGSANGLFLHDLFDRVIPNDRYLHRPLGQFSRWERITRSFGYSGWLMGALALGIALTLSFMHNVGSLQQVSADYPAAGRISGKVSSDLDTLRRQYLVIRSLQARNEGWETRHVWLGTTNEEVELALRNTFVTQFRKSVLNRLDQQLAFNLTELSNGSGETGKSAFVQFVVRRLNLLQARLDAADLGTLAAMPTPSPGGTAVLKLATMVGADDMAPATAKSFDELYAAYLAWNGDLNALGNERDALRKWLKQLALSDENLNWMVAWANEQAGLEPVRLSDFWPAEARSDQPPLVEAGYTAAGLGAINGFFRELDTAAAEPQAMATKRKAFDAWYRERRVAAWRLFAANFDLGRDLQSGEAKWRLLLPTMATTRSPHFRLMERIATEFEAPEGLPELPEWITVVRQLVAIKPIGRKDTMIDAATRATGVLNATGKKIIEDTITIGTAKAKERFNNQIEAAKAYEGLYADLAKIVVDAADGSGRAQKLAADFHLFSVDANVKDSAIHAAYGKLTRMRGFMSAGGDVQPAWDLAAGPLNYALAFVEEQSACALQKEWDAKVFFPTQGASSSADLAEQLYGAKGSVWAFANETARPFLVRGATGYQPVTTLGVKLGFSDTFLFFVNDAMAQKLRQAEAQKQSEADQKKQQLLQKQQELDRQKKQNDTQKKQQALQARQQDVQKQLADLDRAAAEAKAAAEQLRAALHAVTINALPTGVNAGAKANPFQTTLTVQCAPTPTSLNNFNFPVNVTLNWNQNTCGDTTVQVKIENLTLVKRYSGPQAFARFIQDFYSGEHVFTPQDFPAQKARLEALDVSAISVRYTFAGQESVLRTLDQQQAQAQQERDRQKERQRLEALRSKYEQQVEEAKQDEIAEKNRDIAEDKSEIGRKIEDLDKPPAPVESSVPKRIVACWDEAPRRNPLQGQPTAAVTTPPPAPAALPPAKPKANGSGLPASDPKGQYYVQVGLFEKNAEQALVARLRKDKLPVRVGSVLLPEGRTYGRVRVGPYLKAASAREVADWIDDKYRLKSLVMRVTPAAAAANDEAPKKKSGR